MFLFPLSLASASGRGRRGGSVEHQSDPLPGWWEGPWDLCSSCRLQQSKLEGLAGNRQRQQAGQRAAFCSGTSPGWSSDRTYTSGLQPGWAGRGIACDTAREEVSSAVASYRSQSPKGCPALSSEFLPCFHFSSLPWRAASPPGLCVFRGIFLLPSPRHKHEWEGKRTY